MRSSRPVIGWNFHFTLLDYLKIQVQEFQAETCSAIKKNELLKGVNWINVAQPKATHEKSSEISRFINVAEHFLSAYENLFLKGYPPYNLIFWNRFSFKNVDQLSSCLISECKNWNVQ
jgi:hypothetical protein